METEQNKNRNPMKKVEVADFLLLEHSIRVLEDELKSIRSLLDKVVKIVFKER